MARLATSGGETRDHPSSDIGSPDGFAAGTAMCVTDTTTYRSGAASIKCPGASGSTTFRVFPFAAPAAGQAVFGRVYFQVASLPSSDAKIAAFVTSADGALVSVRLTSAGTLELWNDAGAAQIGGDTSLVVETGRWYRLQLRLLIGTGAVDEAELRVQTDDYQSTDESVAGTSLTVSDTHASRFRTGWIDTPGVSADMFTDDFAVNDSTGTKQVSWPGEGHVVFPKTTIVASAGSWLDCSGGAVLYDAINKTPPVGLADHTTAGHSTSGLHQIRVAVNTAQTASINTQLLNEAGFPVDTVAIVTGPVTGQTQRVGSSTANQRRAQRFRSPAYPSTAVQLAAQLRLSTVAPADSLVVELQADSSGVPSGTALATATIPAAQLSTTVFTNKRVDIGSVALAPSTDYWIVLYRTGAVNATSYYEWAKHSGDPYVSGGPAIYNGTTWTTTGTTVDFNTFDHAFGVYTSQGSAVLKVAVQSICHGEAVTGVKGGTFTPTVGVLAGTAKTFNFGDNVGVAGTYPTNWRWATALPLYDVATILQTNGLPLNTGISLTKNSGSGTSACMVCAVVTYVEWAYPPSGWVRYQKTVDSTFWWAKRSIAEVSAELSSGAIVTVPAGDWLIYPEPQVAAGGDLPTTTTTVTDATLQAGYVAV